MGQRALSAGELRRLRYLQATLSQQAYTEILYNLRPDAMAALADAEIKLRRRATRAARSAKVKAERQHLGAALWAEPERVRKQLKRSKQPEPVTWGRVMRPPKKPGGHWRDTGKYARYEKRWVGGQYRLTKVFTYKNWQSYKAARRRYAITSRVRLIRGAMPELEPGEPRRIVLELIRVANARRKYRLRSAAFRRLPKRQRQRERRRLGRMRWEVIIEWLRAHGIDTNVFTEGSDNE